MDDRRDNEQKKQRIMQHVPESKQALEHGKARRFGHGGEIERSLLANDAHARACRVGSSVGSAPRQR